jgi:hypothetical protein
VAEKQTANLGLNKVVERGQWRPKSPKAPGAVASPQMPGQVPDRSTVPGFHSPRVPRVSGPVRRPLTQYGTAQEIMHVFPAPNEEPQPAEFEQATASVEELRKAYPWQLPPVQPSPVFALDQGVSLEPPALPVAPLPELVAGQPRES